MSPCYKQPVIVFGVVAPLLILFVLLGVVSHSSSRLADTYQNRKEQYVEHKKARMEWEALERQVMEQHPQMKRWMALFETHPSQAANSLLNELKERYSVQAVAWGLTPPGGIGSASRQPSRKLRLSFRGTYQGLQNTFLELETRMPQLQLDSIQLKQDPNRNLLTAHVTYTAWQKE